MKILHTSDWHLGKTLEGYSRIEEQKLFINELEQICNNEKIDLIIIAGDIYDTINPSSEAEKLFYYSVKLLSNGGKRPIIIISGNHDSPNRIVSSKPLADEFGIILIGTPKSIIKKGNYKYFSITDSKEGFFEIEMNNEKLAVIYMPYPNEKNLNEIISEDIDENKFQKSYSEKIKDIFNKLSVNFKKETINIIVGHFYITGGNTSNSERNIQLGGSYAVESTVFPNNTQYAAMGHLHRPQRIKNDSVNIYYSGSPIEYSKSEINYPKCVYVLDIDNENLDIKKVELTKYKPIEVWKCENVEQAFDKCIENKDKNCWVYIEIKTDKQLMQSDLKKLRELKNDIIEIEIIYNNDTAANEYINTYEEINIKEQFELFYESEKEIKPSDEIIDLFLSIANNMYGDDEIETGNA